VNRVKTVVTARLADGYLVAPKVTVFVKEFRGKKAAIIGAVRRPGLYTLKGEATFLELLSLSGGLTERAGPEAAVKRNTPSAEKGEKRISIDLERLVGEGDTSLDIQLVDGDSVYIGTAGEITVTGEVHRPGTFTYEKGMLLETAVTLAGGFTLDASKENISITRKIDGREEVLTFVYNDRLLLSPIDEGDRIHIPDLGVFYVTGEVMRPGEYKFERGTTVIKAVTRAGGFSVRASKGRMKIRRKVNGKDEVINKMRLDDPLLPDDVLVVPESFF
jgi:protein involved in polysaccharide export with SLBB domain